MRILLCLGALTGLGSELPGIAEKPTEPVAPLLEVSIDTSVQALQSDYRLPIVPLAQVPVDLQREIVTPVKVSQKKTSKVKAFACPLEVRAIVEAETMADSFAMLSVDGDTSLVHLEQVLNTPAGSFVLGAIQSSGVVLHKGNQKIRCSLGR